MSPSPVPPAVRAAPTFHAAFMETARARPEQAFVVVPPAAGRDYLPEGLSITYGAAAAVVDDLEQRYRAADYGPGHRVALMLDNRPEHLFHLLALNAVGASMVPINGELMPEEVRYLIEHAGCEAAIVAPRHAARMQAAAAAGAARRGGAAMPVLLVDRLPDGFPAPLRPARAEQPGRASEACILYTSGTTGKPKGCVVDNEYYLQCGTHYAEIGGRLTLRHGEERSYNPLPLFHVNAGVVSPSAMVQMAGTLIVPDRFHPRGFWEEVAASGATLLHYLGIMPPILMKAAASPAERAHRLRFGFGAGIDPGMHAAFEERFGFPMVEVWGMTEACLVIADAHEPRRITTRAFGRPAGSIEARVVDEQDRDVADETPGEMLIRARGPDPRRGLARGYLDDPAATAEAWRGGWLHTGDIVTRSADGMLTFVERRKNIIRRSGENISAAEVENVLIADAAVAKVAVLALPDELREEEVAAAIVPAAGVVRDRATAEAIQERARALLAYHKLPGWIVFVDDLPTTSTQKVRKGLIFSADADPRQDPRAHDLREGKRRRPAG
jgi:acyl-CoA synthetase (AMP-forming)/AMP-acid ligase II